MLQLRGRQESLETYHLHVPSDNTKWQESNFEILKYFKKMDENILTKSGTELALDKHIDFIVNYGKTHDKYVISSFFRKNPRFTFAF